jgi:predicted phosphoribosyltransferase
MSDGDASRPDWGNVRFGRRPRGGGSVDDPAASRFAIGLTVFLVVALAFPWYAYWVVSKLMVADANAAIEQMARETAAEAARFRAQVSAQSARQQEYVQRERLARVRVRGISVGSGSTIAIVDLGAASLAEATPAICEQVQRLRGAGSYDVLRVQRFRGSAPALPLGAIRCGGQGQRVD